METSGKHASMLSDSDDWQPIIEKMHNLYVCYRYDGIQFACCERGAKWSYLPNATSISCHADMTFFFFFQITQYLILKVITRILNALLFVYHSASFGGRQSQGSLPGHLR